MPIPSADLCYNKNVKCILHFAKGADVLENRIKELRKQNKITQDELAKAVRVTRQTVISLENGKYNASLQLAHKLAKYFGVSIEDIFIFEED